MSNRQQLIADELDTVRILLARYKITDMASAARLMRERATPDDLNAYTKAIKALYDNGALG